jgi:hypothetical protein
MTLVIRAAIPSVMSCLLLACSPTTSELVLDTQQVPAAELVRRVTGNAAGIHTLTGSGSVDFESPDMGGSVFFTLALRKPDSLLLRLEGPFGIDVGFLFLSRGRYVLYNSVENRVMTGVPSDAGIRWGVPLNMTVDQILNAFTGTFALPEHRAPTRYAVEDDAFVLTYADPAGEELFRVDPATTLVTQYRKTGGAGEIQAETGLPEQQGSYHMPRQITLELPDSGQRLSVYYSSFTVNPGHVSFAYTVPRSAVPR